MIDASEAALLLPFWRVERILFDERGFLVVDKPPGMPVYGGNEAMRHAVVDRLERHLSSEGRSVSLGVHQRLDQDTSGLLFFTTDPERNVPVARAMEEHSISRIYHAVVDSSASKKIPEGTVRVSLRSEGQKSVVVAGRNTRAKDAVTHFSVLKNNGDRALLECRLETGRKHQIRATLAHLGFPILGDRLYGNPRDGVGRLLLHAVRLSGDPLPQTFESETPPEFLWELDHGSPRFDEAMLRRRLADSLSRRAPLLVSTDALRLVNGEGDGLSGMTIDAYGRRAVINLYDESWLQHRATIQASLVEHGIESVYLKRRVRADLRQQDARDLAPDEPLCGPLAPDSFVVRENALRLNIELHDGLSTGLFVDMRDNRERMAQWMPQASQARRMLNLFSYTCSFSVAAALTGAETTSVDLSGKALDRGRKNFEENGLDPNAHRFFKEDAMKFLARSVRRKDRYDFIVLDPPSFSTVKKGTFSVKGRYQHAATDCLRLLQPGGKLLCVTNHTKTTQAAFLRLLKEACERAGRTLHRAKVLPAGLDCPDHAVGPWPSKSVLLEVG